VEEMPDWKSPEQRRSKSNESSTERGEPKRGGGGQLEWEATSDRSNKGEQQRDGKAAGHIFKL
jgi:hypothetical protein